MAAIHWHSVFFLVFALFACGFALAVVLTSNIVRMAFYLVLSLGATSGLFFLAGADFVGGMQLLIYVGGTLVLLIFGVMLTAQSPFISMKTRASEWIVGALLFSALSYTLLLSAFNIDEWRGGARDNLPAEGRVTASRLGMGLLGARVDQPDHDPKLRVGMSGYLLPFEIVSVHLLVVLIGSAYLARPKKRLVAGGEESST